MARDNLLDGFQKTNKAEPLSKNNFVPSSPPPPPPPGNGSRVSSLVECQSTVRKVEGSSPTPDQHLGS